MRTAGSLSPLQQYVNGMLRLRGSGLEVAQKIFCHLDEASSNYIKALFLYYHHLTRWILLCSTRLTTQAHGGQQQL